MSKGRLEAFSDGVFAVAITLLILDVRPEGNGATGWEMLAHDWRKILVFLLSFLIVGVYWVAHHHMMHFVTGTNRSFLWLNLLLLLIIVFIPYAAAQLSASNGDAGAIRIYGATLVLTNLAGTALWAYATGKHRLVDPGLPETFAPICARASHDAGHDLYNRDGFGSVASAHKPGFVRAGAGLFRPAQSVA